LFHQTRICDSEVNTTVSTNTYVRNAVRRPCSDSPRYGTLYMVIVICSNITIQSEC